MVMLFRVTVLGIMSLDLNPRLAGCSGGELLS
jgi:hypothetical protein